MSESLVKRRTAELQQRWEDRRWHYRRSLASRVMLLTVVAVGISVAVVALGAYATARLQMQATLDDSLENRAVKAAEGITITGAAEDPIPSALMGAADVRIIFIRNNGVSAISADDGPPLQLGTPEAMVATGDSSSSLRTISAGDVRYRVVAVPARGGGALVLAQSLAPQERVLERLGLVMLLFGAAGVIAASLAGWVVASNGLRPVRRLTLQVERIARTEDLTPLPVEGADEIARLASAFNGMLGALSASRDRQRQLVADAGHELRTPLTSLRTNLELLSQADQSGGLPAEARRELLSDVRAQTEELTTLIGDLVELARDDPRPQAIDEVDLAEVVDRAASRVRLRAPGLRFEVHTAPWWVHGESAAIERAVTNLLDNAAKFSPPAGVVRVALDDGVLTVDDEGPGIPIADRPHVFDRFYRSRESRSMPGSGLGLSIVRQVVERHGGRVVAGSAPSGGARLRMELPGTGQDVPSTPDER